MSQKMNQQSIKRNYIYNTLYQILTLITPFITAPYVSRSLGADKIGIYSYTNSIVTYFTLFAALGTASYGQREISMHREDREQCSKLFWEIEILSIITTGIATIIWFFWIVISSKYNLYFAVLSLMVIAVAFDITWFFAGLELFKYIVIRNSVVKIIGVILLFVLIHKPSDLMLYITILSATVILGNVSMWTYLPGYLKKVKISELHPSKHFKQTLTYFIPTIATSVYTVLDKTMIGAITGSEKENGYYEQATKIIRMIEALLFSLNTVMSSRMSYLFASKRTDEIKEKILKSFDFLLILAIPLMFGLIGIAANFVPWFFGDGYEPVILLLYLMSPLPLVICISNILGSQYLTPSGQRARSSKGIIIGAVVNLCINAILIPKFGAAGATVASVIAEGIISCIYIYMSKGYISWKKIEQKVWKRAIAGSAMLMAVWMIGKGYSGNLVITLVQIVLGVFVYALCLLFMRDEFLLHCFLLLKKKFRKIDITK